MNTIKKLSFNTNINANSNKPFTSRTITKSHRKSRPISTNSSQGRIYSNVNDSKMISKLKSEISDEKITNLEKLKFVLENYNEEDIPEIRKMLKKERIAL